MVALLCYIGTYYIFGIIVFVGPIGGWIDENFDIKSDIKLGLLAILVSLIWPIPTIIACIKAFLSWIGNYTRNF